MQLHRFCDASIRAYGCCIRGQSDKYLASPPDGVTIAREIYYRVVHFRRRQVLFSVRVESDVSADFRKIE